MNINALIKDWAWRVNDGMPDPKNRNHIQILEAVLKAHKYPQEFIDGYIKNLTEAESDDMVKYTDKDGEKKEMEFTTALQQSQGHPARIEAEKLKDDDSGESSEDKAKKAKKLFSEPEPGSDAALDAKKDTKKSSMSSDSIGLENKKSLDSFIVKGFADSEGAPGSAGSMLNEIISITSATKTLNSGQDFNFESELEANINRLKGTGLAKDNDSNNLATGVKKSEAGPIAEKYGVSLGVASKCIIATRAALSKTSHIKDNIIEANNIKEAKTIPFFGDKAGMKAQEDYIKTHEGTVKLGNTEVSKEEAIKIIQSGGGGANPSDTAIFVKDDESGSVHMVFFSDKDNVNAIVAQSSIQAEVNLKKKSVDSLVESGVINKELSESIKMAMDESIKEHSDLESKLDEVVDAPGKHLESVDSKELLSLAKNLSKGSDPQKYWNTKIANKFSKLNRKLGDKRASDYLPDGVLEPSEEDIIKAYVKYVNDPSNKGNLSKVDQRIVAELSNATNGPKLGSQIGKIRKETVATDLNLINKLNENKILVNGKEVGMGTYLEAESVAEKLHLDMMFGGEGVYSDPVSFYQESGGVKVDKSAMQRCMPFKDKKDMLSHFEVGEEKESVAKGSTNITGGTKIVYAISKEGERYPIGEKKQRSKTGILGKLQTVYNYHPNLQKCFKGNK